MIFFLLSVILALILYIVWRQRGIAGFYPISQPEEPLSAEELEKMVNSLNQQVKELDKHIKAQKAAKAEGFTAFQSQDPPNPNRLISHFQQQLLARLENDRRQVNQLETLLRALKMLEQQVKEQEVKKAVQNALQARLAQMQQVRIVHT